MFSLMHILAPIPSCRYGLVLDPCHEAVSVLQGGIVAKQPGWRLAAKPWLLAVEDPQQAGRDIAQGSYNIRNVLGTLADTLHTLQVSTMCGYMCACVARKYEGAVALAMPVFASQHAGLRMVYFVYEWHYCCCSM